MFDHQHVLLRPFQLNLKEISDMHMALASEETCVIYREYAKRFESLGTLSLLPEMSEEEFCEKLLKAMETGIPVKNEEVCMPPLPEGYVL